MRFIHIADVHLGAKPDAGSAYSQTRIQEIWDSFAEVIRSCREKQTDVLLIAGDLFHRQPLLRELKEVNYLFSGIPDTQVVMIAGNHDYIKADSYYRTFSWAENVHMIKSEELSSVEFPKIGLAVYGLSYFNRVIPERKYDAALPGRKQPCEILLAHGGDEKHIPFQKNELLSLGYDYIALGHIHKPQELLKGRAAYAGALEPVDKNDVGQHGYIEGEITEAGCRTRFVPSAQREYIEMDVPVNRAMTGYAVKEEVRQMIQKNGVHNIYKVRLTGFRSPEVLFDMTNVDTLGNIVEFFDDTRPAYDFKKLYEKNKENLLGKFILSFKDCERDSIEYQALCEGVHALMETRRGQL